MVVAPVNAAGTVGLAHARLLRVIAALRSNLAHKRAHTAVAFYLYIEARLQECNQPTDAILAKRHTISTGATVGELYHYARMMFCCLGLSRRWVRRACPNKGKGR